MPDPKYMAGQTELNWQMRQTLVDWLLQVHLRYHLLPETLWIAINIVDRFLTKRVVSMLKLQLVGVTAMFIAAKYEEILAPSVDEFVFMTERGYTKEEILKGERIMLQTLDFKVSHYCSPYSWMRKISKADDYDLQTRTLSKFLTEVTLLDYRFLRVKPSLVAAIGMYTARRMLGGDWVSVSGILRLFMLRAQCGGHVHTTFLSAAFVQALGLPHVTGCSDLPFSERGVRVLLRFHRGAPAAWPQAAHRETYGRQLLRTACLQEVRDEEVPEGVAVRGRVGTAAPTRDPRGGDERRVDVSRSPRFGLVYAAYAYVVCPRCLPSLLCHQYSSPSRGRNRLVNAHAYPLSPCTLRRLTI